MPHLLYDTQTASLLAYPRLDDEPVQGLDSRYIALRLIEDPPPDHDPATEQLEATETIDITAGEVRRGWVVKTIPPVPPAPDVLGFFAELSRNPGIAVPIGDLLSDMLQPRPHHAHAPQAALAFGVGLGQVADRGDPRVFLDAWHQALERDLLTPELVDGVQQLAQAHNLPAEFVSALQPQQPPA